MVRAKQWWGSSILPPYMRRSKALDELIPALYLSGISIGEMMDALAALLGPNAANLSPKAVRRLIADWHSDMEAWKNRKLDKTYAYVWTDGVYLKARMDDDKQCILVLIGVTSDGNKELIGFEDGYRESTQSWRELLLDLKKRGLQTPPKLAIGPSRRCFAYACRAMDGALGFWSALGEVFGSTRHQRRWVHKTANVVDGQPQERNQGIPVVEIDIDAGRPPYGPIGAEQPPGIALPSSAACDAV